MMYLNVDGNMIDIVLSAEYRATAPSLVWGCQTGRDTGQREDGWGPTCTVDQEPESTESTGGFVGDVKMDKTRCQIVIMNVMISW